VALAAIIVGTGVCAWQGKRERERSTLSLYECSATRLTWLSACLLSPLPARAVTLYQKKWRRGLNARGAIAWRYDENNPP